MKRAIPATNPAGQSLVRLVCLLLALITLVLYWPVKDFEFNDYDDVQYLTGNSHIQNGFTVAAVKWAFTTDYAYNWHPLTWLSHLLDFQIFGLNAGGHHFTNLLFHVANTVLLFLLLNRLTRSLWRSAFVAALFAWHPLHVESVAWVAERKDVLSACFWLLTMLAYCRYVDEARKLAGVASRKASAARSFYLLTLGLFALGLLAKPMLVSLPLILLLIDYWPLRRIQPHLSARNALTLLREKAPFFLLAAISCVVTLLAQKNGGALRSFENLPLGERFANALVSYARYLGKLVWPTNLAVPYPYNRNLPVGEVLAAALLLLFICLVVGRLAKTHPPLLVGWLWFLITLAPVIGVVQVGEQALADRYTYIPSIGIFLLVAWEIPLLLNAGGAASSEARLALTFSAVVVLGACIFATEHQLRYWRNSITLFTHAIEVTQNNATAECNLALALALQGKNDGALEHYRDASRINPQSASIQDNVGTMLVALGRLDEALEYFNTAAKLAPTDPQPPYLTGRVLLRKGLDLEAVSYLRRSLELCPDNAGVLSYVAEVLASDENPKVRDGHSALVMASKANDLVGGNQPAALDVMAMAYAEVGNFDEAQKTAQEALDLMLAGGQKDEAAATQQRLQLYQGHQPFRQSFADGL